MFSSFWSVVDQFSPPPRTGEAGGAASSFDPKQLQTALEGVVRKNQFGFWVVVGLTTGLFAVVVSCPFWASTNEVAGLVTGVAGVPAIVVVRTMKSFWIQKFQLELLIVACGSLGPEGVQTLIIILRDAPSSPSAGSKSV